MGLLSFLFGSGSEATDSVTESINAMASVVNDAVQNCTQQVDQTIAQDINISNADINRLNIDNNQFASLKASCLQSNTSVNQLKQDMASAASQVAKSVSQQFSLDSAKASTVARLYANVGESIVNNFVQNCANKTNQDIQQHITIGSPNGEADIGILNLKNNQQVTDYISCSSSSNTTNDLSQQIKQTISQEADAKIESFLGPFVIAAAIVLGIIILVLFLPSIFGNSKGEKSTTKEIIEQQPKSQNNLQKTLYTLGELSSKGKSSS